MRQVPANIYSLGVWATVTLVFVAVVFQKPLCAQQSTPTLSASSKPNIVLIMVDDLGWANLGCYGGTAIATPSIDRLAKQGMRFSQAYSGSVVCAPARCILMTGKHAGHCSVRVNTGGVPLLKEDTTVAELLKTRGYQCGGFGKWALGDIGTTGAPEYQGFDQFVGYYHQSHAHLQYPEYLVDTGQKKWFPSNRGFHQPFSTGKIPAAFVPEINPETGQRLVYAPYEIVNATKQFIRAHQDEPFFCYAAWTPPHGRRLIPNSDPACASYHARANWSTESKVVASMISMLDRQVGEVLDLLIELKIEDNTLVLFCSDHGAALRSEGELDSCGPLRGKKRTVFEGGLRIPMIAKWPGRIDENQVTNQVCFLGDLLPTLSELASVESIPSDIDGISILPTLLGENQERQHEYLFWDWRRYNDYNGLYGDRMTAVRHGDWKLLRNQQDEPWQLFDLANDLSESHDLAKQRPEVMRRLRRLIDEASNVATRPQIEPEKPGERRFR